MSGIDAPIGPIRADEVPPRARKTLYPEPFASRVAGREKRALGDYFQLKNFGVNLTHLAPGAVSALRHAHSLQDEFVYVVEGTLTLITNTGTQQVHAGMCIGFPAGTGDAHHLRNDTRAVAAYLEVGDRSANDSAHYPDDDLKTEPAPGGWAFTHKDGSPYP